MSKAILNTDKFWSAVKRKNVPEMLTLMFQAVGEDEASKVAGETTRLTNLAMTKMRDAFSDECDPALLDYNDNTEVVEVEKDDGDKITVGDIKALCEEGSKKSVKAANKALGQFAEDHPNYKELAKAIKKAKKALKKGK